MSSIDVTLMRTADAVLTNRPFTNTVLSSNAAGRGYTLNSSMVCVPAGAADSASFSAAVVGSRVVTCASLPPVRVKTLGFASRRQPTA